MDPDHDLTAADVVNEWDERRLARCSATTARSATPAHRPRDRARARHGAAGDDQRARRGRDRRGPGPRPLRRRPPGQARLPGHPHRGQRRARPARRARCPPAGSCCASMAVLQGFPSIRWKTAASSASWPTARAGLHLPAGPAGLRLRPRPGGRAAHAPRRGAHARRGRRQPPREVRPDARCTEARGDPRMTPPATIAARHPARTTRRTPAGARAAAGPSRRPAAAKRAPRASRAGRPPRPPARRWRCASARARCGSATRACSTAWSAGARGSRSWPSLLMGIVFMQVSLLKLNAGISRAVTAADARSPELEPARGRSPSSTPASASRPWRPSSAWSRRPPATCTTSTAAGPTARARARARSRRPAR